MTFKKKKFNGLFSALENPRVEGTPKEITSTTTLRQVLTIGEHYLFLKTSFKNK